MQVKEVCLFLYKMSGNYDDLLGMIFESIQLDLDRNTGEQLLEVRGCPIWGCG